MFVDVIYRVFVCGFVDVVGGGFFDVGLFWVKWKRFGWMFRGVVV